MYIGNMETEHYSFYALGKTKKQVEDAILKEWNDHPYREHLDSCEWLHDWYGIRIFKLKAGECEVA